MEPTLFSPLQVFGIIKMCFKSVTSDHPNLFFSSPECPPLWKNPTYAPEEFYKAVAVSLLLYYTNYTQLLTTHKKSQITTNRCDYFIDYIDLSSVQQMAQ